MDNPEILSPETGDAVELDLKIRRACDGMRVTFAELAYYGIRLQESQSYTRLGFKTEGDYIKSLGIPRSSWFAALRVGENLYNLPLDELKKIPVSNAKAMGYIKPQIRQNFDWVSEAQTSQPVDFAQSIEIRNENAGGPLRVPMVWLRMQVPASALSAIEEGLEAFRKQHDLASAGQALEFLVIDRYDRENTLACVHQALKLCYSAYHGIDRKALNVCGKEKIITVEKGWLRLGVSKIREAYFKMKGGVNEANEKEIYAAEAATGGEDVSGWEGSMSEESSGDEGVQAQTLDHVEASVGDLRGSL